MIKSLKSSEILEILSHQYVSTEDIKKIACCGLNRAQTIKRNIVKQLESENYLLPYGLVPTDKVVEYLKINVNYLKKSSSRVLVEKNRKD